jgi:hypothetical protein
MLTLLYFYPKVVAKVVVRYCICCKALTVDTQCVSAHVFKTGFVCVRGRQYEISMCREEVKIYVGQDQEPVQWEEAASCNH